MATSSPVVTTWVVDGNNVMGSRPDGWWRDREAAAARLVDDISRWQAEAGEPVVVVLDGHPGHRLPEGTRHGVEIRYAHSSRPDAADDAITDFVAASDEPGPIVVATSDRRLRQRVEELGASTEGAGRFLARIQDIEDVR